MPARLLTHPDGKRERGKEAERRRGGEAERRQWNSVGQSGAAVKMWSIYTRLSGAEGGGVGPAAALL
jgi:hypothetical protein